MPPVDIPTREPRSLIAGDTWRWDRTVSGYTPADGWALKYAFRGVGTLDVTAAANAAQTGWEISVPAATTAPLAAGTYEWIAWVEQGLERYTIDRGLLVVQPNLATAAAGARQPSAEVMLPILEAEIKARLAGTGSGHEEYEIHGRRIKKFSLEELYALRNQYRTELRRKRNGGRLPPIGLRFVRPR